MRNLGRSSERWVEVSQMKMGERANGSKHRRPWPVRRNTVVVRLGTRVMTCGSKAEHETGETYDWRDFTFLPVALILSRRLWEATGRFFSRIPFWPQQGEKIRKRYGGGKGTEGETAVVIQVKNDEVTCSSCLTSLHPQVHACRHFGFSI